MNFLKERKSKQSYRIERKCNFSVVYVLFINCFKLLGFNYLDSFVVPRQNKRVSSLLFFLLGLTPSFIAARVLGFRKFAKKNKRLLAV